MTVGSIGKDEKPFGIHKTPTRAGKKIKELIEVQTIESNRAGIESRDSVYTVCALEKRRMMEDLD